MTETPPPGLIMVAVPKALLLLTLDEYTRGIRRGKWWRRREAMDKRTQDQQPAGHPASV